MHERSSSHPGEGSLAPSRRRRHHRTVVHLLMGQAGRKGLSAGGN
ncbi:hypothetical protein AKJ08_2110 [Vulgatibacter incomptus]|uniref:Uncharacterized protein n=1 Tax=Vulgatibacter incomptus TaxID=1391653 RepID=A0A0K1PDW8_9BACT|nr:hypothetical protein AKJ08_2110 [Vulgatibacter incomptus]